MTAQEIQAEWLHRYEERLALSAGANKPRPEHFAQAKKEADQWKAEFLFKLSKQFDADFYREASAIGPKTVL